MHILYMSMKTQKEDSHKKIKKEIYSALENARAQKTINKNNEAKLIISCESLPFDIVTMKKYLNVAVVEFSNSNNLSVKVENSGLIKCQRCWNYFSKEEMHDDNICKRCASVINEN